ncbi:MAG TPA: LamG domain-containing protein [Kofleriaceae bacterium]|jgi:hypothetical protein|nr:LamG domain-containing protein [Kofleriaceae bacterium]
MRSVGLLLVVAGCGFHASAPLPEQPPADAAAPDSAAVALDAAPAPDATRSAFCSIDGIVVCFEFEGTADDGGVHGLPATASGVSFPPGKVGMAMQVDAGSSVTLPGNPLFNVDAVTVEAWIRLTQLPAKNQVFDVIDVDNQYALTINDNGTVTCDLHGGPGKLDTQATVAVNQWTHVACAYDRTSGPHIYLDGGLVVSSNANSAFDKGSHPMGIAQNYPSGSQLVGLIDQLRLLDVARTTGEICQDAGGLFDVGSLVCVTTL